MVAVLALLGFAGAWVATRLAGDARATDEGLPEAAAPEPDAAAADASRPTTLALAARGADAEIAVVAEDAGAASASVPDAAARRRSVLDDFDDPWGAAHERESEGDAAP